MTAIKGTYGGLRPVKTRKVWVIEIEIPEEEIKHVTDVMGFPNQSESQWVGVTLLNESVVKESLTADNPEAVIPTTEKSEGDKIRERACILCKDEEFQSFIMSMSWEVDDCYKEPHTKSHIIKYCNITSRSELTTNRDAQGKFLELMDKFDAWKLEQRYEDNLSRN